MTGLAPFRDKFIYDIVGHSGDSPHIPFVHADTPPRDEKERLRGRYHHHRKCQQITHFYIYSVVRNVGT
jgi:hypothetical protein